MNGPLLVKWMKERDMRPEELATKIGVSYATVRNLMAGKKTSRPTMIVLSQIMGVPMMELLKQGTASTVGRNISQG